MDQNLQHLYEQQRLALLPYKDQMPKSMRPDQAEEDGHDLADTLGQHFKIGEVRNEQQQ